MSRWQDEGDPNGHPVRQPVAVLLALPGEVVSLDEDLDDGPDADDDAEDPRRQGNRDVGEGDRLSDGPPRCNGRDGELAELRLGIEDAGVRHCEQQEDSGSQDHSNNGTNGLSPELQVRRGTKEETCPKIARERSRHIRTSGGDSTSDQVGPEGLLLGLAVSDAAKDELGSLGRGGQGCDVSDTRSVDGHKGEDDSEDGGEESQPGIHVELYLADDHRDD